MENPQIGNGKKIRAIAENLKVGYTIAVIIS